MAIPRKEVQSNHLWDCHTFSLFLLHLDFGSVVLETSLVAETPFVPKASLRGNDDGGRKFKPPRHRESIFLFEKRLMRRSPTRYRAELSPTSHGPQIKKAILYFYNMASKVKNLSSIILTYRINVCNSGIIHHFILVIDRFLVYRF